jgi:hypothetical protein
MLLGFTDGKLDCTPLGTELGEMLGSCVGKFEKALVGAELPAWMLLGSLVGDPLTTCVGKSDIT